jgi:hypothetical protein
MRRGEGYTRSQLRWLMGFSADSHFAVPEFERTGFAAGTLFCGDRPGLAGLAVAAFDLLVAEVEGEGLGDGFETACCVGVVDAGDGDALVGVGTGYAVGEGGALLDVVGSWVDVGFVALVERRGIKAVVLGWFTANCHLPIPKPVGIVLATGATLC